jgi:regulator of RNase E activity RraA
METGNFKRPPKHVIEEFLKLSTPNISDALDRLMIKGGCEGIIPIVDGVKVAGPAFTVRYIPLGLTPGTVGDYIDYAKPGDVIVIDNAGRTYCTVWGDLLTITSVHMGIAGTVIDGVCRDIRRIKELQYPVFSRGRFMMTGKDRVQLEAINIPVSISGIQVRPGDLIVGDDNGVVIVPMEKMNETLKIAKEIAKREEAIEEEVKKGSTLVKARKKHGYHLLQRPKA